MQYNFPNFSGESEEEANLRLKTLDIEGDSDRLGGTSQNDYR
jgi:hypothetical protein